MAQRFAAVPPVISERSITVKFTIDIGENEKHRLEYYLNQLRSSLVIKENEKPIVKAGRQTTEPVLEVHVVVVGKNERSTVRIEKERKPLGGRRNRLYVNNRLLRAFEGS